MFAFLKFTWLFQYS